jgi:hypothetical protein
MEVRLLATPPGPGAARAWQEYGALVDRLVGEILARRGDGNGRDPLPEGGDGVKPPGE